MMRAFHKMHGLGNGFVVESSKGHIRDLPRGAADVPAKFKGQPWARLGVNVIPESGAFEPEIRDGVDVGRRGRVDRIGAPREPAGRPLHIQQPLDTRRRVTSRRVGMRDGGEVVAREEPIKHRFPNLPEPIGAGAHSNVGPLVWRSLEQDLQVAPPVPAGDLAYGTQVAFRVSTTRRAWSATIW